MLAGFNAFVLGAKKIKPDIKAYIAFTDSWNDINSESLAVNAMIDAGCDGNPFIHLLCYYHYSCLLQLWMVKQIILDGNMTQEIGVYSVLVLIAILAY